MDPRLAFEQALLASQVMSRFLRADNRYQPPKYILNGVEKGELPNEVLMIWKYVVEKMGGKFDFAGGTQYWRSKCKKEGIDLPIQYLQRGTGAEYGSFKIMAGDQIEVWVKERLKSAGLLDEARRTAQEWELEISHLKTEVSAAAEKVDLHTKGLAEGSRVKQREKWLADATATLASAVSSLEKAEKALADLTTAAERHVEVQAPAISFEEQFQLLMSQALNDMSRKEVLARARAALAAFEQQIAQAGAMRTAGFGDTLQRWWDKVVSCFGAIKEWTQDLLHHAKRLDQLFDSV